jgi:hypothetical protein
MSGNTNTKMCGNQPFYKNKTLVQNKCDRIMPKIHAEEWKKLMVACNASAQIEI